MAKITEELVQQIIDQVMQIWDEVEAEITAQEQLLQSIEDGSFWTEELKDHFIQVWDQLEDEIELRELKKQLKREEKESEEQFYQQLADKLFGKIEILDEDLQEEIVEEKDIQKGEGGSARKISKPRFRWLLEKWEWDQGRKIVSPASRFDRINSRVKESIPVSEILTSMRTLHEEKLFISRGELVCLEES